MYSFVITLLFLVTFGAAVYTSVLWIQEKGRRRQAEASKAASSHRAAEVTRENETLRKRNARLERWSGVEDADGMATQMVSAAEAELKAAREQAGALLEEARQQAAAATKEGREKARQLDAEAEAILKAAGEQAAGTVADAQRRAEAIAGKAFDAVKNAELYEQTAKAMKNLIEGYGDEYLRPSHSLLDDLAEEFEHKQAGQQLKAARKHSAALIKSGNAAVCDYVEQSRRVGAEHFVIDAFNGKVDSILSRVKHDNAGTLEQEVRDAFTVVNFGGKPFRNARITEAYLNARIEELKWAAVAQELKVQEREEQRRIREQIREEEKARREYERAMKQAVKEERILRKAIAEAESRVAEATEAQRAEYERQLQELAGKLHVAEERNQRAMSMAQQTRRGHVYVISNLGSFGENVYKIGLTRRLEPIDRVKELGDSSVPFDFDVHAMIFSEDAPALENRLHKHFVRNQVNKVNHRKEFFRASLAEIRGEIEGFGIESRWTMAAEAAEYRETLAIDRKIADDPQALEAWVNRQLVLEAAEESIEDDELDAVAAE